MAMSLDGLQRFWNSVLVLDSFPLFLSYLAMILLSGLWQRFTKPLSLRPVLVVYNFLCSGISVYTLLGFAYGLYSADFIYQRSEVPALTQVYFWYHVTKKIELLDTMFMVLRHKRRQISILHVYHHSSMLVLSDYGYHLSPWPAIAPLLMLNSAVHVCLYLYYALTALDPSRTPTWKKHLTEMQIVQFYVDMVYTFYGYLYHQFCVYGFVYGWLMIYLFSSFYYHAYIKARPVNKAASGAQNGFPEIPSLKAESVAENGSREIPREKME